MDPKSLLATLARLALASVAGTLVKDGYLQSSGTEAFVGGGMLLATGAWGVWNSYGKDIAKASLDLLRAKVMLAAAKAQASPSVAPQALASVAAHVAATAPASVTPPPVAAALVFIAATLALGLLCPGAAYAQTPRSRPPLTGNIPADIKNAVSPQSEAATANSVEAFLAKPFQDLADFIGDDSAAAIALSTAVPELQDGHGQQCWIATKQFGEVVKAHPVPLTLKAQTDLEALRLLAMAANNLCANPHCTQVFADLGNAVQTLAPLNASIPIPSLHDLCAKVPQVAVVPPIPVPATPPTTPGSP